jgi:glycosyltransferase involved in cell wall biosynthesis
METVSVIIPTYNRAPLVTEAMDSVWDQTYRPIECIVVDDGSTDDTSETVADWKREHERGQFTVRLLQQQNRGAPTARNRGMEATSGDFLLFLDSDDRLVPNAVALLRRALSEGGHDVAYGDIRLMEGAGHTSRREQCPSSSSHVVNMLNNAPQTSSALIKRNAVASVRWREDLPRAQEFAFFLDLALQGGRFTHVPTVVLRKNQRSERRGISNQQSANYAPTIARILVRREECFRELGVVENWAYDRGLVYYSNLLSRRGALELAEELHHRANLGRVLSSLWQNWSPHIFLTTVLPPRWSARVYTLLGI